MAVKVAINGFGRIGRLAFRQMFGHEGSEIVAINDLTSPDMLAYLLKYDSTQGNYSRDHEVTAGENSITVDGKEITIYKEADAKNLPWGELGVDVVLECTGFYTSKEKAQAHINAGAKKVVISAPAGNDLPTIVYNVNHEQLTAEDNIISAASCTTNCLAPMAKGLNDFAPIVSGIMTTIHAWTGDQMPLDGPQRKGNKRRSRACAVNIVPNSTGAAKDMSASCSRLCWQAHQLPPSAFPTPHPAPSPTSMPWLTGNHQDRVNALLLLKHAAGHLRSLRLQQGRHRLPPNIIQRDPWPRSSAPPRPYAPRSAARRSFSPLGTTTKTPTPSQMVAPSGKASRSSSPSRAFLMLRHDRSSRGRGRASFYIHQIEEEPAVAFTKRPSRHRYGQRSACSCASTSTCR